MAGTGIFRNDQVRFAFEEEATEGTAPGTINTSMGIIKSGITLPDVEYAWDMFFGVGREGRSRKDAHEGPQTFRGSIQQIYVLFNGSREILEMCLGELSQDQVDLDDTDPGIITGVTDSTLTDSSETDFTLVDGGSTVKGGNHAVFSGITVGYISTDVGGGVKELTVYPTPARSGTKGWNGSAPAVGDEYEIRQTESVGTAAGNKLLVPTQNLNTMTWAVQHRNAVNHAAGSVGSNLTVNYLGGKVNRFTLSANQGEKLSLALDDVWFRDLVHDSALPSSSVAKYSGSTVTPTATFPTEQPLVFSQGTISLFEIANSFAKIRSFSLSVDHQLTEERYIATVTSGGSTVVSQIPFEFVEGPRVVTLTVEAVMETREYWEHLMRQGQNDALSAKTGFDVRLQFRPDAAAAKSFYIQAPCAGDSTKETMNPVQGDTTNGSDITGAGQVSASNVGAVLKSAPHVVGVETDNLVLVRMELDLPNVMMWFDDA